MDLPHEVIAAKLKEHSELGAEDLAALAGLSSRVRELASGEDFIGQGDKPEWSAVVLRGMVARYHTLTSGRRQYLSFHITGDLPDAQTLFIERMDHAVCAIGDAAVGVIPHSEIIDLFERCPPVGFAIWRETLIDAAIFREAITNIGIRAPLARMAHLFCELYYRSRAVGLTKPGSCNIPLHQGQIGEALGMSIVTVNRTLQQLRRSRAMDFGNGLLIVHDWKRLTELGEFDSNYLHLKRPSRM
jgi:CRP-like cAMP-binding protein